MRRSVPLTCSTGIDLVQNMRSPLDDMQEQVLKRVMHVTTQAWERGKLPCVPNEEAALTELLRGRSEYEGSNLPVTLCMGFSWSLYFAQLANENLMRRVPRLLGSEVVSDKGMPMVFKADGGDRVRHYVYVDNLGIISPHEALVGEALEQLAPCFDERGLILHPGELQHEDIRALGCSVRGDIMATRITPERFIRLRQAVGALLRGKRVSGRILEVVLGHITFCCLCNRQLLCIFNTVYKFIRKHYYSPVRLWESVREELWAFRSLMVFLQSDWWRPWNPLVSASDASLEGYGVSTFFWNPQDVADCGRRLERASRQHQS